MSLNELLENVPQPAQWLLMAVGAMVVAFKCLNLLRFVSAVFLLGGTNLRKYGKPGTWAVVTGASDGLGKEFAVQLASKGFNLVLVSRTLLKLETLAAEIKEKFPGKGLQVKVLAMDYAQDKAEDYKRLAEAVSGLDVGILINNVGQSHSIPVAFLETPSGEMQDIVTINCLGTLKTTRIIAPMLVQRKKGLILTMGSFAGWMPTPLLSTYSGSKAFLQHWSSSLAAELKPDGVDVQLLLSYIVTTGMSKIRRTSLLVPSSKAFVKSALAKVGNGGYLPMAYTYTPYWSHAAFQYVVDQTIGNMHALGIWINLKMHIDIRRRALRKAAREAKKTS